MEDLILFFLFFFTDNLFNWEIYDLTSITANTFNREADSLVDNMRPISEIYEDVRKENLSNDELKNENVPDFPYQHIPATENLEGEIIETPVYTVDLKLVKEGQASKPLYYDSHTQLTIIMPDESSHLIQGMPKFKSAAEALQFWSETKAQRLANEKLLGTQLNKTIPQLEAELKRRQNYIETKDYYLLIHKTYWICFILILTFFFIFRHIRSQIYAVSTFKSFEKKFQLMAEDKLQKYTFDDEAYRLCNKYIQESKKVLETKNFFMHDKVDSLNPLIEALENYRDFCFEQWDFDFSTAATKRIVWISNFINTRYFINKQAWLSKKTGENPHDKKGAMKNE